LNATNEGPTKPEDYFVCAFMQRKKEMAYPMAWQSLSTAEPRHSHSLITLSVANDPLQTKKELDGRN